MEQLAEISKSLLTPLIAIVATYIAWQQYQTNRQKLKLDRYERRLRVYEEVRKILSIVVRDAKASTEDLLKFRTSASEADFLFGPEITEYIDQIYERGLKLWLLNEKCRNYTKSEPKGCDYEKIVEDENEELKWLTEQSEIAKQKFKKYLDISK